MNTSEHPEEQATVADLRARIQELESQLAEARHHEQQLMSEQAGYNTLLRHFPKGAINLLDRDLNFVIAEGPFYEEHGISREQVIGHNLRQVIPPDKHHLILPHYEAALQGEFQEFEYPMEDRVLVIYLVPVQEDDDSVSVIIAIVMDVTEDHRKAAELHRQELMFAQAESLIGIGCYEWDLVTDECLWSPGTYRMMKLPPADFAPDPDSYMAFIHPDDRARLQQSNLMAKARVEPYSGQHRVILPDGEIRVHRCTSTFDGDEDGEPRKVIGVVVDITEQLEAEAARDMAEHELKQQRMLRARTDRLRSLGEMSTGIAHELNQPLVGIRGLSEHLLLSIQRGRQDEPDLIARRLSMILEQADRMSHIIRHVRQFAGSADKPTVTALSLNDVIRSALELLEQDLNQRGIQVIFDLAPDLPRISGNQYSLEEVLINLVINARDAIAMQAEASPEPGDQVLRLHTHIRNTLHGAMVRCQVIDHGVGMPEDVLAKALEPFFTTKAPDQGTGLGLPISQTIVKQMNGTLTIDSKPGHGTTVSLDFPPLEPLPEWREQTWLFAEA